MAWISAGASLLTSLGGSLGQKSNQKKLFNQEKKLKGLEGMIARQNAAFEAELRHFYEQLNKQEKKRGLDQFRTFSTVKNYAPDFVDTNPGPVLPTKPGYNTGEYAMNINTSTKKK